RTQAELAVVSQFAFRVVMMKQKCQARPFACLRIPQHCQIAVRVAERENRPPADVQGDVLRLRFAIVEAIEFSKLQHTGPRSLRPSVSGSSRSPARAG